MSTKFHRNSVVQWFLKLYDQSVSLWVLAFIYRDQTIKVTIKENIILIVPTTTHLIANIIDKNKQYAMPMPIKMKISKIKNHIAKLRSEMNSLTTPTTNWSMKKGEVV